MALTLREVAATLGFPMMTAQDDRARREVRIWSAASPATVGQLFRYVEDTAGVVTGTDVRWWSARDATVRTRVVSAYRTYGAFFGVNDTASLGEAYGGLLGGW